MSYNNYLDALEMRMRWLKWVKSGAADEFYKINPEAQRSLGMYEHALETGDTFFMGDRFGQLVDYARKTIPDDLTFDPTWMISPAGFMWMHTPFDVPVLRDEFPKIHPTVAAIAWFKLPEGVSPLSPSGEAGRTSTKDSYSFICFQDLHGLNPHIDTGFGLWSYFILMPGDKVLDRIRLFERISERDQTGMYVAGRETDMQHEIRWVYTALHLMSQKLTTTVEHTDRSVRRRMEKEPENLQLPPFVRLVTLRRLEEDRKKDPQGQLVDWQWQWRVHGHWRNQWYASEQVNKIIWIEDYIKGPPDKPLKPPAITIYQANR